MSDRLIVSVEFLAALRAAGLELTPDCELRELPALRMRPSVLGPARGLLLASQPVDDPSEGLWSTDPPPRALPPHLQPSLLHVPRRLPQRGRNTFSLKRARLRVRRS